MLKKHQESSYSLVGTTLTLGSPAVQETVPIIVLPLRVEQVSELTHRWSTLMFIFAMHDFTFFFGSLISVTMKAIALLFYSVSL